MQHFLLHYGYAFFILGLIIEGDATLVAAAMLAGENYFKLNWVLGLAIGVSFAANHVLYELGRLGQLKARVCKLVSPARQARVSCWLHNSRSGLLALICSRFMWGCRLVIPFAAGVFHLPRRRFVWTNLVGAAAWSTLLVYCGVALQAAVVWLHDDLIHYQSQIAIGLFLAGLVAGIVSIFWNGGRRQSRRRICLLSLNGGDAAPRIAARSEELPPVLSDPIVTRPLPPVSAAAPNSYRTFLDLR